MTKAQLEMMLKAVEQQSERRIAELEEELWQAKKTNALLERAGLSVWWASAETVPHLAISFGNGISAAVYDDQEGNAIGLVVYDDTELVGAFGHVPVKFMLEEIEYVRRNYGS